MTFQLAWVPLTMKPLKFGLGTPFVNITLFNFHHKTH
jgi:hypothetical protein